MVIGILELRRESLQDKFAENPDSKRRRRVPKPSVVIDSSSVVGTSIRQDYPIDMEGTKTRNLYLFIYTNSEVT